MNPDTLVDTAYRFFGDGAIAAMVSFLLVRFLSTRPGNIATQLVAALQDGKVTADEINSLKQLLK